MMRLPAILVSILLVSVAGIGVPSAALAQSTGLDDMVGARAGQAEGELQRRGYVNTGGQQGDDRSYTNWWNADRRQCVTIATMNGRYDSITPTTPPDCRKPASTRPRPSYGNQPGSGYRPQPGYLPQPGYQPQPSYVPDQTYPRSPYRPGPERPTTLPGYQNPIIVDGHGVTVGLICFGDGSRDGLASGTVWTWNRDRDRYEYGQYNESRTEVFDASLMVQTWDGGGRIRLPRSLIPPLNSRGINGWWDLKNLSVGPDVITATYRLNGLNKPRVVIDRRSGRISIQGTASYGFRGVCQSAGSQPRQF